MKKIFSRNLLLFFGIIFSIVNSKEYKVEFNGESESFLTINNENEIATITINVLNSTSYTKLSIIGEEDLNYVLSVYSDVKRENRIQLAQSFYKNSTTFLTKKQIGENKIFVDIECSSIPCSFKFIITPQDKINLNENEQLYYYVTENNTKMDFSINLKSEKANVWSRGGQATTNTLNSLVKSKNGNYFIENEEKVEFTVVGKVGDLINVGSIGYNEDKSTKIIFPDEETITVFLLKPIFTQACFSFGMREETSKNYFAFIEGIIQTKILKILYKKNGDEIESNSFSEGKFSQESNTNELKNIDICFTFPNEIVNPQYKMIDEIIFNYHITLGKSPKKGLNFYEPQINGQLYQRNLLVNEIMAFIGLKPEKEYLEMNYNLFNVIGYTKLYVYDCDNYPLCLHKNGTIKNGVSPKNIDSFTTYSIYTNEFKVEYNPISKNQKLLIAYCVPNTQIVDLFCKYNTLIYSNEDAINMIENQYFNQYLLEKEIDNFKFSTSGESKILKANIDIIVYIGDVEIIINSFDGNEYSINHSANKYYISITFSRESENLDEILFKVKGKKNSFYTIVYSFLRKEENSTNIKELHSGMNYLLTIDPSSSINEINIINDKYENLLPFMINFYSLNCKLEIYKKLKNDNYLNIDKFNYCYEDVLSTWDEDGRFMTGKYEYKINIQEEDYSIYNGKLCMVYVSSVEINKQYSQYGRDIIIPDNTPQQIMFNSKINHISYAYIHVNNEEDLIVKLNLIHKAEYLVKFLFEYTEGKNYTINSNDAIYLNHSEWKKQCPEKDQLCYIIIDIALQKIKDIGEPVLELSIKSVNSNTAIYIPKNLLKIDYIQNNITQHYFTEVGQKEIGFILVNFYRGSGKLFAKLVKKKTNAIEEEADWCGKYKFPQNEGESLAFDSFTKKINFDTSGFNCQDGCYLLISILPNVRSSSVELFRNYQYSIIVKSSLSTMVYKDIPSISIPSDEYIIGDIIASHDERIKDFFSFWINYDADKLIIDFQSYTGNLFINVGNEKPESMNSNFRFLSDGKDSIYTINKNEIINEYKKKGEYLNSINNTFLTIGISSNMNDSFYTTFYSFMLHLESNSQNIIHRVKSDRKTLCDTTNITDSNGKYSYRCLFVIEYHTIGELNNLLLYPTLQDKSASYQIYAEYINSSTFEMGNQTEIYNKIPTKNSEFSTDKTKLDYLYIPNGLNNGNYLLVNVISTKNTRVELISTFYTYLDLITPNPVIPQLFLVKKDDYLILDFPTEKLLIINLISITGKAEIYWEDVPNNKYYLEREDDRLSITSLKGKNGRFIIKSFNNNIENDIGFAFYLTYTIRYQQNFDEIILGKSVNFVYSESDFPISLYSRLENIEKDANIFFTIYEMENKEIVYNNLPIKSSASLVKEKIIYDIKSNNEISIDFMKEINYIYDHVLRTGMIKITKEQLKHFNIDQNEKPYLLINLEKSNNKESFKRLSIEITSSQDELLIPLAEKIYQYEILLNKEIKKEFLLKTSPGCQYINFEFSSFNDELLFNISTESGELLEKLSEKSSYGKKFHIFKVDSNNNKFLKLIVFKKDTTKNENNFVFKYMNLRNLSYYKEYMIDNDEVKVETEQSKNNKNNYKIKINAVKNSDKFQVNYFVKIYKNESNFKPFQCIAIEENNNSIVKEFINEKQNNDEILLTFNDVEGISTYMKIIAQIIDEGRNEFLSYKIYEFPKTQSNEISNNSENSINTILIVILVVFFIIIIVLIIVIFIFKRKNKDLFNEANKMSFNVQEGLVEMSPKND